MKTIVQISLLLLLFGGAGNTVLAQSRGVSQLESGEYSSMAGKPILQDLNLESDEVESFGDSLDALYRKRDIMGLLSVVAFLDWAERESGNKSEHLNAKGLLKVVDEMVAYRLEFADDEALARNVLDIHNALQLPFSPALQLKMAPYLVSEPMAHSTEDGVKTASGSFRQDTTIIAFDADFAEEAAEEAVEEAAEPELMEGMAREMERERQAMEEAKVSKDAAYEEAREAVLENLGDDTNSNRTYENVFGGEGAGGGSANGDGAGMGSSSSAPNSAVHDSYGATLFVINNTNELLYLYVNDEFIGPLYGGQSKKLTLSCKDCQHVYAETPSFEKSKRKICAEPMSMNEWVIVEH